MLPSALPSPGTRRVTPCTRFGISSKSRLWHTGSVRVEDTLRFVLPGGGAQDDLIDDLLDRRAIVTKDETARRRLSNHSELNALRANHAENGIGRQRSRILNEVFDR